MCKKLVGILIGMLFIITSINIIPNITNIVKADITTGLISYWSFNNGNANDDWGSNNGVINEATYVPNGGPDASGCYQFDGSNDYIDFTTSVVNTPPYSLCAWVKTNSITGPGYILANGGESNEAYGLSLILQNPGDWFTSCKKNGGPPWTAYIRKYPASSTDWTFLCVTWDGSSLINLKLYVNGVSVAGTSWTENDPGSNTPRNLCIGASSFHLYSFDGKIDEVRIYNRELSESDINELYNQVNQPPIADANGPYNANTDENINLDGTGSTDSDGFIFSYEWDLDNDGTFDDATGATPSWSWSTGGSYPISLKVTDNDDATDTDGSTVYVNEYPFSDADGPYYANKNETISLDGSGSIDSDGTIVSYSWDLNNDGAYDDASGTTPSWSWPESGTYAIGLKVTDDDGASDTDTSYVFIELDEYPPIASFTYSPEEPKVGDTVSFDASGSSDLDGSIVSFSWDFGDDTTGSGMITRHMYNNPARYTVVLTVIDNDQNYNTDYVLIEVGTQGDLPVAYFTFSPDSPCVNETVLFDASSSFSPVGVIESYVWDLGDNTSGTGMIINHNYTACENYSVNLTVFDNRGFNDSFTKIICINLSQVPNIVINRISGSLGISVNITNIGTGTANDISWSIDVEADFGFILSGNHAENVIDELETGCSKTIKSSGLRGIGLITINVQVADVVKQATAFLLGPLVLRLNEI